ncbi:MAG: dihydrofolate reductase [Candidatus Nomurabacteria bacterium]|nr:dihydrofolate reductase [Candidatus Nomurabacteria bacterium]
MSLSIIAAVAKNNVIGNENKLLWNIPLDMKFFKNTTTGHPIIMGRKTFLSIGRALPNRRNIVITRDENFSFENVEVFHSIEEIVSLFKDAEDEAFIIGGADIYKQFFPIVDKLYITHVDEEFIGDTTFPEIDQNIWKKVSENEVAKNEENPYQIRFATYTH